MIFVTETERVYCAERLNIKIYFGVIFIFKELIRVAEQACDGVTECRLSGDLCNVERFWWNLVVNCVMWRVFGGI